MAELDASKLMTTAAQDQLKKRHRRRAAIIWTTIFLLIVLVLEVFDKDIQRAVERYVWRLWYGSEVTWRGLRVNVGKDHFIFPNYDSEKLIVGGFGQSSEPFPDDSILMLTHSENEDIFLALNAMCKEKRCDFYRDTTKLVNGVTVRCIEFKALFESWGNREFHVHCQAQGSDVMIEYHGGQQQYKNFHTVISSALQEITQKTNREEAVQSEQ